MSQTAQLNTKTTTTYANRRRSQRLFLQIPIVVEGKNAGKSDFAEKTRTIVVNAHGALVELSVPPEQGGPITLMNVMTNEKQSSKVILVTVGDAGKFNVALEFTNLNPSFWHVHFPPEDWSVRHPDAKRSS